MGALAHLPALADFESYALDSDVLPFLSSLALDVQDGRCRCRASRTSTAHAASSPRLRHADLILVGQFLIHIAALIAAVPRLQYCTFGDSTLPSLADLGGAHQLRAMSIWGCWHFRLANVLPLTTVVSLRELKVELAG